MYRTTEPRPTSCPAEMILPDYEGDQPQDEGPEDTNSRRTLVRRVKWPAPQRIRSRRGAWACLRGIVTPSPMLNGVQSAVSD
jgi:hypothetical protein